MEQRTQYRSPSLQLQKGFSLVELMVAMTIGLFLMGAVGIIYVNTSQSSRGSTLESQMNEDATLALELLQQQIRLAGFSTVNTASGDRNFSGIPVFGCDGGFSSATNAGFDALTCNGGATSDSLSIRYEANSLNSQTVAAGDPGNCVHEGIGALSAAAESSAAGTRLADNRYYVADDNGTPSLVCRGRTGDGFGDETPLIPNIEDMQIQYAVTFPPVEDEVIPHQVAAYVDASNAVLGGAVANWSRVAAIRICLLARSAAPVPAGSNSLDDLGFYRDCNGDEQTANDRFIRRAYVTTIQLRNARPALPAEWALGANPWAYLYEE